jgi:hypothetical protein
VGVEGPLRRLPFAAAALVGIALIAVPLATSEVSGARAGDTLIDITSPLLTTPALREVRADLRQFESTAAAIDGVGIPRLAALAHQTPEAFRASLATTDPEVSRAIGQLPVIRRRAETVVSNLERRRGQFASAASLPAPGVSLRRGVWAGLGLGGVLVVAGLVGLASPRRRLAAAVTVVGVLLVAAPLALGYPAKTADTDALLDSLRPFSVAKVQARQASLDSARTFVDGFRNRLVPETAAAAGTTPGAVSAELAAADDLLSPVGLRQADVILDRFGSLVRFSARIQPLLVRATRVPARALTWLLIGPGAALAVAGGLGLWKLNAAV